MSSISPIWSLAWITQPISGPFWKTILSGHQIWGDNNTHTMLPSTNTSSLPDQVHHGKCYLHNRLHRAVGGWPGGKLLLPGLLVEGEDGAPQQKQNDSPPHPPHLCWPLCKKNGCFELKVHKIKKNKLEGLFRQCGCRYNTHPHCIALGHFSVSYQSLLYCQFHWLKLTVKPNYHY